MKILVVDDDDLIRDIIATALEREGFETVTFDDAQKALGAAENRTFDLVIVDNKMPGMTGSEFIANLRGIGIETPVLGISGDDESYDENTVDAKLKKPFARQALVDAVNALIKKTGKSS